MYYYLEINSDFCSDLYVLMKHMEQHQCIKFTVCNFIYLILVICMWITIHHTFSHHWNCFHCVDWLWSANRYIWCILAWVNEGEMSSKLHSTTTNVLVSLALILYRTQSFPRCTSYVCVYVSYTHSQNTPCTAHVFLNPLRFMRLRYNFRQLEWIMRKWYITKKTGFYAVREPASQPASHTDLFIQKNALNS